MVSNLASSIPWIFWVTPGSACVMFWLQRKCHPVIGYFLYQLFVGFLWLYWYMSWFIVSDEVLAGALIFAAGTLPVFAVVLLCFAKSGMLPEASEV